MVSLVKLHGVEYLFAAVILMGVLQLLAGIFRPGKFIRMVPYPVMLGFVNGLAIVIFRAQLRPFQYTSPSPDAEPYVRAGDRVKRGQVLCIVEAMKLMNEIESDEDGVIEKAFPKNAQPVEFGEPLFAIVPD